MLNGQKPTLLIGGSSCAESGDMNESLKSLQFVFRLYEKHRREGRYFMQAQPEVSKSWHEEEFVKKLSGETACCERDGEHGRHQNWRHG